MSRTTLTAQAIAHDVIDGARESLVRVSVYVFRYNFKIVKIVGQHRDYKCRILNSQQFLYTYFVKNLTSLEVTVGSLNSKLFL